MKTILYCAILCLSIVVSSCSERSNKGDRDSLSTNADRITESVDVVSLGLVTSEDDNKMIGQDVVYKKDNDTFTLSFRRTLPKTGTENILLMVFYDKIPVETPVSSLAMTFSDGNQFVIESDFFMPLKTGQFGNKAGKDSGKKIQGFTVVIDDQSKLNLKNSDLSTLKAIFASGDQIEVPINKNNALKIKEFLNTSFKVYR
ncbi:MAG: hypothetical protein Q8M98_06300 [Candidatus Cloacimonadaceae bacterium]|nr:hypothetical protein [Candidatus Cloacimonadaceae bacterium]